MRRPSLVAERALLHPLWVLALVVTLVNDHQLKGAGIAPGWLTGKLSDLAGWLFFPMLLATVLRVRSRAAAAACHAASAALLLLLELSPGACSLVERWLHVRLWADPTDLVALASIAASWLVLVPAAERSQPLRLLLSRSLAAVGGLACIATSPPPPTPRATFASAFLWNRTSSDVQVRVSTPRQEVLFRCEDVEALGPEAIFQESHFRVVRHVVLTADGRLALDGMERGDCTVLLVAVEGAAPRLVTWRSGALSPIDIANVSTPAGLGIEQDAFARTLVVPAPYRAGAPARLPSPAEGPCLPPPPFTDAAWSDLLPFDGKTLPLRAARRGVDGCDALELGAEGAPATTFILCINPLALPFAVGDALTFRRPQGADMAGVVITSAAATVVAASGPGATVAGKAECMPSAHDCVVATARQVAVSTPAGMLTLAPGAVRMASGGGYQVSAHATRAEVVHVADQECDAAAVTGFQASYAWVALKEKP